VRLLSERYEVEAVADGEAALAAARARPPELIVSDVMMPRLDGFGLLRELRAHAGTRTIPVILLSARAGEESHVEGLAHGADDYLIKPFSAREMLARIAAHLDMARMRREAQAEVTRSHLFVERIAAASPDMLFVYDVIEQRNVYMNRSVERVLGYTVERFQSVPDDLTAYVLHPDDLRGTREWYARFETAADGQVLEHEHRMRHADGSYRWICARATMFERTPEGRVKSIIGVAADITVRKQAEEDIRRLLKEAEQREQELIQKQEQLVQAAKLASIGELATGVAHELNNPLNNIGLFIGNLLDLLERGEVKPAAFRQALAQSMSQVHKAAGIISHLRTFGRLSPPERRSVAINEVVASALSLIEEPLRHLGIEIDVALCPDDLRVCGNAIHLEQVLINFLSNARDAVSAASVKKVAVRTARRGEWIDVSVQDSGCGMTDEHRSRIFDPFFTTKEVGKGTGLGLSISYGIIKDHGGTIDVSSHPGEGSTFTITLPVANA
jgi:PAS domain S-box-containing protein